jgi:hypothetical protein
VLQVYADRLYAKAAGIALKYGLVGLLIGMGIAAAPAILIYNRMSEAKTQEIINR